MKNLYHFVFLLFFVYSSNAQDYFINEDFRNSNVKVVIPFVPDWSKDFFVETEVKVPKVYNGKTEYAGLIFGYDTTAKSFYGLYIQHGNSNEKKYKDFFLFEGFNTATFENNDTWQETSLINYEEFNRLQVYKIDNELFFAINDQVVYHINEIQSKGEELKLASGKSGLYCHYFQGYYLDKSKSAVLRNQLLAQFETYKSSGIHYKIANDYSKVLNLKEPEKIKDDSFNGQNYFPEIEVIIVGNENISFAKNVIYYDSKTGQVITEAEIKSRLTKLDVYNENNQGVRVNPTDFLERKRFIGKLEGSLILLKDIDYGFSTYDCATKKTKKLIKASNNYFNIIISDDYKYLSFSDKVYSLKTGDEIEYTAKGFNSDKKIIACFDDKIIVENGKARKIINLITKEEKDFEKSGTIQDNFLLELKGRELSVYDLKKESYIAKNLQLMVFDRDDVVYYRFKFFPKRNEVYVYPNYNLNPIHYFSEKDNVVNTSSFIVNINTNEITPFLFYKSASEIQADKEKNLAIIAKSKVEVDAFLSQFKTFGSYYELNYNNFEYVNVSGNPFFNKYGIGGTTYVIGKFCTYDGGYLLALGITKDQYQVELISVTYSKKGVYVGRSKLGFTQIVNGVTTQLATVKVYRDSTDKTKYTLIVNDGKESKNVFSSNCN